MSIEAVPPFVSRAREGVVLVDYSVELVPDRVDGPSAREGRDGRRGGRELSRLHWCEFSDWHAVAGDQEGFASIKAAHDVATGVAELSLGDSTAHRICWRTRATGAAGEIVLHRVCVLPRLLQPESRPCDCSLATARAGFRAFA